MTGNPFKALLAFTVILFALIPAFFPVPAVANDSGAKPPTSYESGATMHHAESAYAADNVTATADRPNEYAVYKNFGITTLPNATIEGIEVTVLAHSDSPVSRRHFFVSLSSDKATTYTTPIDIGDFGTAWSYRTVGGPANKWGRSWTSSDFNDDHFRVKVQAGTGVGSTYLDTFQVKVYYVPDTARPAVTINQASGQLDPTGASPINFTAVFSELVTGFNASDVLISGTAGAGIATITGSGTTYNIAMSGMTDNGTVIVTIAENVVRDAAGNFNLPSTSTDNQVMYDTSLPTYTITVTQGANGTIIPGSQTVYHGDSLTFNITADTGYQIGDVRLDGVSVGAVAKYQLNNIIVNHTISAVFTAASQGTVIPIVTGGAVDAGGLGGLTAGGTCPVVAQVNVNGSLTTFAMTKDGVTCNQCLAMSNDKEYQVRIEEGTRINSTENIIPKYINLQLSNRSLPEPSDGVLVSAIFEVEGYRYAGNEAPLHLVFNPNVELALAYDADKLPENASEVDIAYYDEANGWTPVAGTGGPAEVGMARGKVGHFTPFAVIARAVDMPVASISLSELSISPATPSLNEEVKVNAVVVNDSGVAGEYAVNFLVDGKSRDSRTLKLDPHESTKVTFVTLADTTGTHRVMMNQLGGQFEVLPEKKGDSGWLLWWLVGLIVAFVIWRFRRRWSRLVRRRIDGY